jgi:hypothetical protein
MCMKSSIKYQIIEGGLGEIDLCKIFGSYFINLLEFYLLLVANRPME